MGPGKFAVILPAAGRSTRFGDAKEKKIFTELDDRAVWLRAAEPFLNRDDVAQMFIVIAPEDRELFERRFRANVAFLNIAVVEGGVERYDSVASSIGRCSATWTSLASLRNGRSSERYARRSLPVCCAS